MGQLLQPQMQPQEILNTSVFEQIMQRGVEEGRELDLDKNLLLRYMHSMLEREMNISWRVWALAQKSDERSRFRDAVFYGRLVEAFDLQYHGQKEDEVHCCPACAWHRKDWRSFPTRGALIRHICTQHAEGLEKVEKCTVENARDVLGLQDKLDSDTVSFRLLMEETVEAVGDAFPCSPHTENLRKQSSIGELTVAIDELGMYNKDFEGTSDLTMPWSQHGCHCGIVFPTYPVLQCHMIAHSQEKRFHGIKLKASSED